MGCCEDCLTCDIAFNAVMPLSRASTRGSYSRIEGVTYAYNILKMPGPISVISVPGNKKDALICADKIYREAAAATDRKSLAVEAPGAKKNTKSGKSSDAHSGKRTSSECCATVEDAPSSSTGKCKKTMVAPPETKKVPVKEDGTGGAFTISSTLDGK